MVYLVEYKHISWSRLFDDMQYIKLLDGSFTSLSHKQYQNGLLLFLTVSEVQTAEFLHCVQLSYSFPFYKTMFSKAEWKFE